MRRTLLVLLGIPLFGWALYSLFVVGRYGGAVVIDPSTTSRVMAVRNDQTLHSAVGLTYHGLGGAALVIAELALVLVALAGVWVGRKRVRIPSASVLLAWAGLWFANALWLQASGWDRVRDVVLLGAVTAIAVAFVVVCGLGATTTSPRAGDGDAGPGSATA